MKKLFGLVLLFTFSLRGFAAPIEPVFVMLEQDPWAMVIGSDSPGFVLYNDGTVIFQKKEAERKYTYYSCKVESAEQLLSELTPQSKHSLSNDYSLSAWTDQPTTLFFWKDKYIRVYGKIQNRPDKPDATSKGDMECPPEIVEVVQRVKNFDCPAAKKMVTGKNRSNGLAIRTRSGRIDCLA